ncbi:cyclic nucleotide-binding domain-containing protein [Mucilaginibacter sp.]|uniref:Crp/Fnr family transcriptional regulator n=1 Tax=Mucilaginibacter sp. TaxID=1882438 RepID=UPI0028456129|nr:cyclic nucleotide-binding domain-containing protein [Mucilaginibacter sp.]MDR3695939.1 cyclic nucleotide-binding domain-containing protein [Mucilaginibacter sp.]
MKTLELAIAKHPFFHDLPAEDISIIAGLANVVNFKEGDVLFKEGADADKFYLVIQGKVALEAYNPGRGIITIQTVEDGEMLGWSWLVPPYKYRFGAKVITKTEMIVINGKQLRVKCDQYPVLGYEMMKRMVRAIAFRLEQTRLMFMDVYGKPAKKY